MRDLKEKLTRGLKNASSQKSENLHFDVPLLKISAINKLKFTENRGGINDSKAYLFFVLY